MQVDVAPIDAFAPLVDGCYADPVVTVGVRREPWSDPAVRTEHFDLSFTGGRVRVAHGLAPSDLDGDLAGLLHHELFGPGWLRGGDLFHRVFTGVVRSCTEDAAAAWEGFYRTALTRLSTGRAADAPVHEHAMGLLAGDSVLELGCCFGFPALRLALSGRPTIASDVCGGTVRLLDVVAPRLGVRLGTVMADAARFPAADGVVDTVLAVRLLEHLEPDHGTQVLQEAVRLAARRVVLAVSLESEADETYGHVRTVSLDDLRRWGLATGRPFDVHELHGGWLVVDTG